MSRVVYLYGFVPVDAPAPPADLAGIAGRPVALVDLDGFRAAVSELDAEAWGPERIDASLHDLGWVGEHGAAHERVVTWLADHATITPARLFTIFSSRAALAAEAGGRAEEVRAEIERFRDLREWDLKISFDAEALGLRAAEFSEALAELDLEIGKAAPGRRYLLERRRAQTAADTVGEVAARQARRCLEELAPLAERVAEQEIPGTRGELPVVLRAALLVRAECVEALRAAQTRLADQLEPVGIHVSLTGPWAPYRFVGAGAGG